MPSGAQRRPGGPAAGRRASARGPDRPDRDARPRDAASKRKTGRAFARLSAAASVGVAVAGRHGGLGNPRPAELGPAGANSGCFGWLTPSGARDRIANEGEQMRGIRDIRTWLGAGLAVVVMAVGPL